MDDFLFVYINYYCVYMCLRIRASNRLVGVSLVIYIHNSRLGFYEKKDKPFTLLSKQKVKG